MFSFPHHDSKLIASLDQSAPFQTAFAAYRTGYAARYVAMLEAKSRCLSTLVAGPARFPARAQRKRSDFADRRTRELLDYRTAQLAAITKLLRPELGPIMAGDADAAERLRAKLAAAEKLQATMTAANGVIRRHTKEGADAQIRELIALGIGPANARALLDPNDFGRPGFAPYQLTNNGATIRNIRKRLAQVEEAKATPTTSQDGAGVRFEDSPADNRVRLFFDGKPPETTRSTLKSHGFRWTPSIGCWQGYRNDRAMACAKKIAGISG